MTETCLYTSQSTLPTQKKHAHYSLIREIKRLRKENLSLHNSISLLKSDLHDASQSRHEADAAYKKIYEQLSHRNQRLELDLMEKQDEIEALKHSTSYTLPHHSLFHDETFHGDTNDHFYSDDEDEEEELEPFTSFIPSYFHQAFLSKLTSARVRLELDDYILKYDASQNDLSNVLASSFLDWIHSKITTDKVSKVFMTTIQTGIAGFWQEILSYFAHDTQAQYRLLKDIEQRSTVIADHFHHLLLMLYKHHIVDDEATLLWWRDPCDNDMSRKMRDMTLKFVNWIQDSEDEDDSDDEEEEEEEEQEEVDYYEDDDDEDVNDEIHVQFEHDFIHFETMDLPAHVDDPSTTSGEDTDDAMPESHSFHLLTGLFMNGEYCICAFTTRSNMTASFENKLLTECSCKYMSQQPAVVEKKEKSVRIAM